MLPADVLRRYLADPLAHDPEDRKFAGVPDDAYYVVSVWPLVGRLPVERRGTRAVSQRKISKSSP